MPARIRDADARRRGTRARHRAGLGRRRWGGIPGDGSLRRAAGADVYVAKVIASTAGRQQSQGHRAPYCCRRPVPTEKPERADSLRFLATSNSLRSVIPIVFLSRRSMARSRPALLREIAALRQQVQIPKRSRRPRLRLTAVDRLLWVWFSRIWTEWRSALVLVQPATVVEWHRRGFRLFWTWTSRRRTGRPTV